MSDRSEEVSVSRESDSGSSPGSPSEPEQGSSSTEELLEETERLLGGGLGSESGPGTESVSADDPTESIDSSEHESEGRSWLPSWDSSEASEEEPAAGTDTASRSWFPSVSLSRLSLSTYFSPKAFLALVLVLGFGLLAGSTVLPIAGNMVGMFVVAFTVGLLTSRRRYNEMIAAGATIGGISAMFEYTVPMLAGSSSTFLAIGVTAGFLACVVGYYFGRDLRSGLSREI